MMRKWKEKRENVKEEEEERTREGWMVGQWKIKGITKEFSQVKHDVPIMKCINMWLLDCRSPTSFPPPPPPHSLPSFFSFRYCFLAFNFDERVTASRENCRLLLLRLKLDGWALGKTKVFLKYYHVEYLTKMYEKQASSEWEVEE